MRFPQLQGLVGAPKLKLAATVADAERVMPSLLNESAVEPANRESVKKKHSQPSRARRPESSK